MNKPPSSIENLGAFGIRAQELEAINSAIKQSV